MLESPNAQSTASHKVRKTLDALAILYLISIFFVAAGVLVLVLQLQSWPSLMSREQTGSQALFRSLIDNSNLWFSPAGSKSVVLFVALWILIDRQMNLIKAIWAACSLFLAYLSFGLYESAAHSYFRAISLLSPLNNGSIASSIAQEVISHAATTYWFNIAASVTSLASKIVLGVAAGLYLWNRHKERQGIEGD